MAAELAIRSLLVNDTEVKKLVAARVYPGNTVPQDPTHPYITYERISGPRVQAISGPCNLAYPRIQVDCWSDTYAGAKALGEKVRLALDGYRGTVGTTHIAGVVLDSDEDDYEPATGQHILSLDFIVWYRE